MAAPALARTGATARPVRLKHPVLQRVTTDYRRDMRLLRQPSQRFWAIAITLVAIALPFFLTSGYEPPLNFPMKSWLVVVNLSMIGALGAAAFNLLVGYTGQLSLAHGAFLTLGAIVGGSIGTKWEWNFWLVLIASLVIGAGIGILAGLPALRLRGLYLLLATLGITAFSEPIWKRFLVNNYGFSSANYRRIEFPSWVTDLPGFEPDSRGKFQIDNQFRWYCLLLPITVLTILFLVNVVRSREGRAFAAVRERDVAASLLGVNVAKTKLASFAVSSAVVTMSGTLGAYYFGARGEASFPRDLVFAYAVMIVVGGFSSIQGGVFGAFFYYAFQELTKWGRKELPLIKEVGWINKYGAELDLAIFGALIVVVLVARPDGLTWVWRQTKAWFGRWPFTV